MRLHEMGLTALLGASLSTAATISKRQSTNPSPYVAEGNGPALNQTLGAVEPVCYDATDQLFFSLASAHNFNYQACAPQLDIWKSYFKSSESDQWTFWTGKRPDVHGPDLHLPVFSRSESCAIAVVAIQQLYDFTAKYKLPWRKEWGPTTVSPTWSETGSVVPKELFRDDLTPMLECTKQGRAGFVEDEHSWLRVFVWPGYYTTFGDILSLPGGTDLSTAGPFLDVLANEK